MSTPGKTPRSVTTVKFSLDNPFYQWPETLPMDHQILISKLNDLKASISAEEWKAACVLDPNELLRLLETGSLGVVFAFKNDLKYPMAVAHLPFMCRQSGTPLVELKAGAAQELASYLQPPSKATSAKSAPFILFMFALKKDMAVAVEAFCQQFPKQPAIDPTLLPALKINKK